MNGAAGGTDGVGVREGFGGEALEVREIGCRVVGGRRGWVGGGGEVWHGWYRRKERAGLAVVEALLGHKVRFPQAG